MYNRGVLPAADEGILNILLSELEHNKGNSMTPDRLRKFLQRNGINARIGSCVGRPPILFYLLNSVRGRLFLLENMDLCDDCEPETLNYGHHDTRSVMREYLCLFAMKRDEWVCPENVLATINAEKFNRVYVEGVKSIAVKMLSSYPEFILRHLSVFEKLISAESLNASLYNMLANRVGLEILFKSAHLRAMISAETLNKVVNQICSPAEIFLDEKLGRDILAIDAELRAKLDEIPINTSANTLVADGLDLLRQSPDICAKFSRSKLAYHNGFMCPGEELLTTPAGQALLHDNPELTAKIKSSLVNRVVRCLHKGHMFSLFHPFKHEYPVQRVIAYSIMATDHGREFLEKNDVIRKMITDETLQQRIHKGAHKGRCAADLLKQPAYKTLRELFAADRQAELQAQSVAQVTL